MDVDDFRFITQLNTQVRTLATLSQIVRILGTKQLPKQFLKQALEQWSYEEEKISDEYRKHRGKVTENEKPTSAFSRYLKFMAALGLVTIHSDLVLCSRFGFLLTKIASESSHLSSTEKLFYLMLLFRNDADTLLLTLELLKSHDKPAKQSELKKSFEGKLKQRLLLKQKYATSQASLTIHDQYRKIEYVWQNAEGYAEHIIPPRLEWMKELGILQQTEKGSLYYLTSQGEMFYKSLPHFPDTEQYDINEPWLRTQAITAFSKLIFYPSPLVSWADLDSLQQHKLLAPLLKEAFNLFNNEGARRISLYPSLLFIAINLASTQNVVAEIKELEDAIKENVIVGHKKFSARPAARANEGYITVNVV